MWYCRWRSGVPEQVAVLSLLHGPLCMPDNKLRSFSRLSNPKKSKRGLVPPPHPPMAAGPPASPHPPHPSCQDPRKLAQAATGKAAKLRRGQEISANEKTRLKMYDVLIGRLTRYIRKAPSAGLPFTQP